MEAINWEIGTDIYTWLYTKERTNTDLLYSRGNSSQYSVMINMGKESKKKKKGTALLVEMQIDTATLENSMEIPLKKTRNKPTMRPGNPIAGHKA